MPPKDKTERAREYVRVSVDKSGRERSPEEQRADNKKAAGTRGWALLEPSYKDIGSASRYAKKARKGFDKLMADLEKDTFGADVLVLWEASRGSRKLSEWVRLLELCEERGVRIYVTSDSRLYDPGDGRDLRSLQEDGVDAQYESFKTSKRTKRNTASFALEGRPHGPVPFGYSRTYNGTSGSLEKQLPHPQEAKVIRELFRQLHRGVTLNAIARDFEARGLRTRTGKVFIPAHLRTLALSHTYCGQRVHDPHRKGHKLSADATFTNGNWPALVSRSRFLAVQATLRSPERKTTRPGRGVHLLSHLPGAVVCDACGGVLAARPGRRNYSCVRGGHVSVGYDELNTYVEGEIVAYLGRSDNLAQLTETDDGEVQQARDAVAEVEGELRDLAARVGRGELSQEFAALTEPGITTRLAAARKLETELSTPAALAGYIDPGESVAQAWERMPMSAKRTVARIVCSPRLLGQVRVTRSPVARRQVPVEDRVVWRRG